jgi:hypothetical protein
MVLFIEQRISRREEINFNFFVLQLWKKSGFYSGILLDFEVSNMTEERLIEE